MYWVYSSLVYTNAPPHIGHLYELVIANSLCECLKTWYKAKLCIGADDHGAKIQSLAKTKCASAIKISNLNSNKLLALCSKYKINVKDWISTSYPRHVSLVLDKLGKIGANGTIYKLNYCGWYSPQLDCYYSNNSIRFSKNAMYCAGNVPTEWTEEQSAFIDFSKIKRKLIALYRANLVSIPYVSANSALEIINSTESVCITRSNTTNYGVRIAMRGQNLVLWVWIDAILAYIHRSTKNKIHVVGKDVIKFHLAHYVALSLLLAAKLPRVIMQHAHINTLRTKVSKTLKNQPNAIAFQPDALYYYLCTRSFKTDVEFTDLELITTFNRLANNIGNLVKRVIKLLALNQSKLMRLTVSEWIIVSYAKQLPITLKHLVKSFKLNEVNDTILNGTAKINAAISSYKLWRASAHHKLFVYTFATKQHIRWLKLLIGDRAKLAILNISRVNIECMPFPKQQL
ncbi:MAG: class I tRNA ligase family protein [Candidatus Hodgkinia cicadicola]